MDRALKERVIGAAVLVIFVVLVVPVFLDGPATDAEMVSHSVSLPGQNDQTRKSQTIVLERDRTEPVPVPANTNVSEDQDDRVVSSGAKKKPPVVEKIPVADTSKSAPVSGGGTAAAPAESPTGMWAVQLGSFSNQANADRLAADLRKQGYAAFLSQLQTDSGQLHRVRIGPQKSRDSAEAIAAKLSASGHKGQVVAHP